MVTDFLPSRGLSEVHTAGLLRYHRREFYKMFCHFAVWISVSPQFDCHQMTHSLAIQHSLGCLSAAPDFKDTHPHQLPRQKILKHSVVKTRLLLGLNVLVWDSRGGHSTLVLLSPRIIRVSPPWSLGLPSVEGEESQLIIENDFLWANPAEFKLFSTHL